MRRSKLRFDAVAMRAVEKMALAVPVAVERAFVTHIYYADHLSNQYPLLERLTLELEWQVSPFRSRTQRR